jgi:hypothetical protein
VSDVPKTVDRLDVLAEIDHDLRAATPRPRQGADAHDRSQGHPSQPGCTKSVCRRGRAARCGTIAAQDKGADMGIAHILIVIIVVLLIVWLISALL